LDKSERFSVVLMVALLAFAVVLVDERLLRTAVAVLPALWLAQRALHASPSNRAEATGQGGSPRKAPAPVGEDDRRTDLETRAYIDRLIKHLREFYATCHLMGSNVLTVEAAEERATRIEGELNRLLAEITQTIRANAPAAGSE